MGSKALYRKHRSKTLDEVVGQQHITDTLKNALAKGAISHAYLFTGPRGVGKTSIARILAHAVNDLDYSDETTHLDIIEIDAASNRRIDEIRDLRDKVHIAPTSAKYKVYIIDEVHMLTREAFNALLKTLEEPPEHAVFILATTESHKVPDTIMSRTQRFTFKPISGSSAIEHLKNIAQKEKINISDDALQLIAEHGNGSFRDSISMLDQLSGLGKEAFDRNDVTFVLGIPSEASIQHVIEAVASHDTSALFSSVETLKEHGLDANQVARSISRTLRNDLMNNNGRLEQTQIITLLQNLLALTSGSADYTALELALLDGMKLEESAKPVAQKAPPKLAVKENEETQSKPPEEAVEELSEITEPDANAPEATTERKDVDEGSWKSLLDDIKGHHNTLYGVLRMAEADHDDKTLTLSFKFGFHKKQVDSAQNLQTLKKYVGKHFGPYELSTIVKKAGKDKTRTTTQPEESSSNQPSSDNMTSVSNIFGGAELLE